MTRKPWNTRSLAVLGTFFGIVVGVGKVMTEPFLPNFDASEPFHYVLLEVGGCGAAGALLFAVTA